MGFSHEIRGTPGHQPFLVPARSVFGRGAIRYRKGTGHRGSRRRRPQLRWRGSSGRTGSVASDRASGSCVGCRLDLQDGMSILVYPTDRAAYSRLTRLLTLGKSRGGKANCILHLDDVALYADGLIGILVPDLPDETCAVQLRKMAEIFGRPRAYVSLCLRRRPNDQMRLHEISNMAARASRSRTVVTNDVLFHEPVAPPASRMSSPAFGTHNDRRRRFRTRAPRRPVSEATRGNGTPVSALSGGARAGRWRSSNAADFSLEELTYQYPEEAIVARHGRPTIARALRARMHPEPVSGRAAAGVCSGPFGTNSISSRR